MTTTSVIAQCRIHIVNKERELTEARQKYVDKNAVLLQLPRLKIETVNLVTFNNNHASHGRGFSTRPIVQVRLDDAKTANFSSTKKQCDLWEFVWGSSSLLSSVVTSLVRFEEGERGVDVLEIGGGLGLTSLAMRSVNGRSCRQIVMTDLVRDALKVFEMSARLNGFSPDSNGRDDKEEEGREPLRTRLLNWNTFRQDESIRRGEFDVVLASDVLFGSWCVAPVADAATFALRAKGVLLLSDPCRLQEGGLVERLKESGAFDQVRVLEFPESLIAEILKLGFTTRDHATTANHDVKREGAFVNVFRAKLVLARRNDREFESGEGTAMAAERRDASVIDFEGVVRELKEGWGMMEY